MTQYFRDRERGPIARTHETIGPVAWGGIVAAISSRISKGAFGHSYPEECPDGQGPIGTSAHSMGLAVLAEIPDLAAVEPQTGGVPGQPFSGWPVVAHRLPPTLAILDLVEFCHEHVAEPLPIGYHTHFKHDHLRFDRETGTQRWSTDI